MKNTLLFLLTIFLVLFSGNLFAQPSNDNCAGATPLTVGSGTSCSTTSYSWTAATASAGPPAPTCASYSTGDVWFSVTVPASGQLFITTTSGTITDGGMAIYSGACGSLTQLACSDDVVGLMPQITQTGLTVGATIYIRVWDYNDATSGSMGICVTNNSAGPPSNDNCAGAVALTMQTLCSSTTSGTTVSSSSSMAASSCGGTSDDDVWYTFTTAAGQTSATIQVTGGTIDAVVEVFSGTCASPTSLGCINSSSTGGATESLTVYGLTGSTTYRVRVYSGTGSSGTFNIVALSNPNYALADDATSTSPFSCVTLTTATNNLRGCAWDINSSLNMLANFTYDYTVNLGSSDAGADGMAFVIQNDPQGKCECGVAGGSLGAGGITNSLIVELDTYLNAEDRDDGMAGVLCSGGPEPDHLDIWLNGVVNPEYGSMCVTDGGERVVPAAVPLMNGGSIYNIENGANHILRIAWNSSTNTLTATVLNSGGSITYGTISHSFNPMTVFGTNTPNFGFTASTGGLNNSQSFCLPSVLLPIELGEFNAICKNQEALLTWNTLSEINNSHFTIERSADGENFEMIGQLTGAGTSSYPHQYEFQDNNPKIPYSYYRLRQTDFDGTTKISGSTKVVACNPESAFSLQPNLLGSGDVIRVNFNSSLQEGKYTIAISDVNGKTLTTTSTEFSKENDSLTINAPVESGIYFVTLVQTNGTPLQTEKLIVQ